ncbi:MAG: M20/M25/M40 family metallo-hydrolase [Megasphaera sp.]|jgi:arginine utilization protein RocB|nr:M20/M25/M40 family metallo-hydrolase [Megasphaera sp.]MCH4187498.1 M20/M25/M40 family metallo-hydrolase [Megasphaera sp.]MCH4217778.1 M20/M25/M40 family metallo-hydrolase [Megasphaera sp.]
MMDRNERVMQLLRQMISIHSETGTDGEVEIERYLHCLLSNMPNVMCGMIHAPHDLLDRSLVYGYVAGKRKDTVVFLNHHDVVGIEAYGSLQDHAYTPDLILKDILRTETDEDVLKDAKSGDWLFGRGSCDMKGGAAAQLAVFEEYAYHPGEVSLLYVSLPDEEAYSAGMRTALSVLKDLRDTYGLVYRILVNSEPNSKVNGKERGAIRAYTGSVGKMLPVVLVQGKTVHLGNYKYGVNPIGILSRLIATTEGDMSLTDHCGDEVTPPPAWIYLRDRKQHYDVSLPQRAAACANFMTYGKTPDDVMYILMDAARHAVAQTLEGLSYTGEVKVISAAELMKQAMVYPGFDVFYKNIYNNSFVALQKGESSYAGETIHLLEQILNFTNMTQPMVVIAIAPPYYPAADSLAIDDGTFPGLLETIRSVTDVTYGRYFNGISDCSYCCPNPNLDEEMVQKNLLLWGKSYGFDFTAMAEMQIPFLLLGPWGKDLHERTERVHISSVSEKLPAVLEKIISYVSKTLK